MTKYLKIFERSYLQQNKNNTIQFIYRGKTCQIICTSRNLLCFGKNHCDMQSLKNKINKDKS